MLDISSTTKGLLLPRLTAAQQATLAATLTAAQTGMLVTDATTGKPLIWSGAAWKDATGTTITATAPLAVSSINTLSLNPGTASGDLITWDGNNWVNLQPAVQHFSLAPSNLQPYLTLNYCIALQGVFPSRNSALNPYLAEIDLFSFSFVPKGWAMCNGQLMQINTNQALFALLGTTYGGDGRTTFALPNLQGRIPMHMGNNHSIGEAGGVETNTFTR